MTMNSATRAWRGEIRKKDALAAVRAHRKAEHLTKGNYWDGGRGCAVGCLLHDFAPGKESEHALYEPLFGIPQGLARLEDTIFESLPEAEAQRWPERFLRAVPAGADLSRVQWRFLRWLLRDSGLLDGGGREDVRDAIDGVIAVLENPCEGRPIDRNAARSAAANAESAARSAEGAARSAAKSAESAAESAMEDEARSAAIDVANAACSAAESAAESAAWRRMAGRLIVEIRAAPVIAREGPEQQ